MDSWQGIVTGIVGSTLLVEIYRTVRDRRSKRETDRLELSKEEIVDKRELRRELHESAKEARELQAEFLKQQLETERAKFAIERERDAMQRDRDEWRRVALETEDELKIERAKLEALTRELSAERKRLQALEEIRSACSNCRAH